ncbi:SdrD B-like domain-containing protein [Tuwongella immobilis]|uniref:SD-repeat containing protein B domain-containing protein n=1 Tax=Tuwongella immobilis TaxID=692036 RepID=A0A6C2YR59_9BACT|nr:SdrD B-like domain-containing protein [Tuwongella immobilis]VIP03362.1 Hemolysin-type calcium-binding region domain protein OS=Rhodopirellula maiorica SM1 GN=RMSM_03614 PE=4 SV=1: Beta_helix [Tuwongella immobilis]VTS04096.1 Hemolysin-type calcium-binding region domain protein OS=Rhodopirellula maiorica SM1 GN=RMSM_03614 PE=4 SV=1: Beta_helix [Tuwongella immobilis]
MPQLRQSPLRSLEELERRDTPTTWVVNTSDDVNIAVDGKLTLREALLAAITNSAVGDAAAGDPTQEDVITFDLGPNPRLLVITGNGLPTISGGGPLRIDGSLPDGKIVHIDGSLVPDGVPGLIIENSSGVVLHKLTIARFRDSGIIIQNSSNVTITSSTVGTNPANAIGLGNRGHGIHIRGGSQQVTIGGTTPELGNRISANRDSGVRVEPDSHSVAILGNIINGHGTLGIDRGIEGVGGTGPTGPAFPVLSQAHVTPNGLVITGTLTGRPLQEYRVEFFRGNPPNASGHGEATTFISSIQVITDANGVANFRTPNLPPIISNAAITATATDWTTQDTSEFAANILSKRTGGTVHGVVFRDNNFNGIQDAGEPGIANAQVYVDADGNNTFSEGEIIVSTNSLGEFMFTLENDGNYSLRQLPIEGFTTTTPFPPAFPVIGGTKTTGISFGNRVTPDGGTPSGSVSGIVYRDLNQNSVRDADDPLLPGVRAYLDLNNNQRYDVGEPTGFTNADGVYTITAPINRTYLVRIESPSQLTPVSQDAYSVTVTDGRPQTGLDFGLRAINRNLLLGGPRYAVGADAGGAPIVRIYAQENPEPLLTIQAFDSQFTGGVRVAMGDVNRDGIPDVFAAAGPGAPPEVRVYDGQTGMLIGTILAFEASFRGGVFISTADFNFDGVTDFVVSPDQGGGPRVRILDGNSLATIADFFGIEDPNFRGGARVAITDINRDDVPDLLIAAGFGGGPRVAAFDGRSLRSGATPVKFFGDFFLFEPTLRNGVYLAGGDIDGDGFGDLVAGGGPGGGPRVFALSGRRLIESSGADQVVLANFFAGSSASRGGIRLSMKDLDGDNRAEIVAGAGTGDGAFTAAFRGSSVTPDGEPTSMLRMEVFPDFRGGVYVG